MAVRRAGISGQGRPEHKSLGRVLVTIDDLEALCQQLNEEHEKIRLEFAGGDFDSAQDLRHVSDEELRYVAIKTSDVEIILSDQFAHAIGPPNSIQAVYENWARMRQTKRKPHGWFDGHTIPLFLSLGLFVAAPLAPVIVRGSFIEKLVASILALVVGGVMTILELLTVRREVQSYAIVVPMTMNELRSQDAENRRSSKTVWAAIVGATIGALATVAITLITVK
jgi:hypothetical protein